MAQFSVNPRRDQNVFAFLGLLHDVIEARASLHHGRAADDLAYDDETETCQGYQGGEVEGKPGSAGKKDVGD